MWGIAMVLCIFSEGYPQGLPYRALSKVAQRVQKKASPWLVRIWVQRKKTRASGPLRKGPVPLFSFPPEYFQRPAGPVTGVILGAEGWVLTSAYNVWGAQALEVELFDGSSFPAKIVGSDMGLDLALLKLKLKAPQLARKNITSLPKRVPRKLEVGDFVFVVGRSQRLSRVSISFGIVGRIGDPSIFVAAKANYGNTGGLVLNMYGDPIGMVHLISHDRLSNPTGQNSGVCHVLPLEKIHQVIPQLVKGKHLHYLSIPPFGAVFALSRPQKGPGLEVRQVVVGTPAWRGGLKKGDFLWELDGVPIYTFAQVFHILKANRNRAVLEAKVRRKGRDITISIPLRWVKRGKLRGRSHSFSPRR